MIATRALALCIAVWSGTACTSSSEPQPPNIVFILIDTLRADHLSGYGYERETTPYIDSLGAKGAVFEAAIAQSSWTAPSMASLWTSRLPSEVGVQAVQQPDGMRYLRDHFVSGMREDATTLAELLSTAGYSTIAVTANSFTTKRFFMLQGFSDSVFTGGLADHMFATALERLDQRAKTDKAKPAFVYVHLTDIHHPITPPAPYDQMFDTLDGRPHHRLHTNWAFHNGEKLHTFGFKNYRSHKLALYDGALRFVDDQLAKFRSDLETRGIGDNTIVVVASDHGEDFWENAEFQCEQHLDPRPSCGIGHGHSMSQQVLHVPLVMTGPGVPIGRISRQVRNLDIAPTLLELVGFNEVPSEMRGLNLFEGKGRSLAISEDIAYGHNARAIQDGVHKLVVYGRTKTGRTHFLFRKGSGEKQETLIADDAIEARLAQALERGEPAPRKGREVDVDEDTLRALRALGYVD